MGNNQLKAFSWRTVGYNKLINLKLREFINQSFNIFVSGVNLAITNKYKKLKTSPGPIGAPYKLYMHIFVRLELEKCKVETDQQQKKSATM